MEDNIVNRQVILGQLSRLGIHADVAENGSVAYAMYQDRAHYDIILSDCHMPEMDGFALANLISQQRSNGRPYLIAITADAMSGSAKQCFDAGFDDYLSKPCPIDVLEAKLKEVVQNHLQVIGSHSNSEFLTAFVDQTEKRSKQQETQESPWARKSASNELPIFNGFDQNAIIEMSGGDWSIASDIISTFINGYRKDIEDLERTLLESDIEGMSSIAHRIKGTCLYLGAEGLSHVAKELEDLSKSFTHDERSLRVEFIVSGLSQLASEAEKALKSGLAS